MDYLEINEKIAKSLKYKNFILKRENFNCKDIINYKIKINEIPISILFDIKSFIKNGIEKYFIKFATIWIIFENDEPSKKENETILKICSFLIYD